MFVCRCAKGFAGEVHSGTFWCSCDHVTAKLVGVIGSHVEMKMSMFEAQYKPCLRIEALKVIVNCFDAFHDLSLVSTCIPLTLWGAVF